ncbi:GntR family transcriptional regulator [Alcaligenes endophyticus]|uniref:FCD domain-containing protein n=1 Tax=Alcaligenes endophyticus TaxID=1929088 RepID=A0ABT8EFP9_9BURK|nr:FCD domain-containing protein [Alcaligenes endophyticus]MCX5590223.1 FCD domain-containing protein [Alcaligenes endophyticus]MDN4120113.1 FCD domain-containing protein [Alcaligenes endophyticus]
MVDLSGAFLNTNESVTARATTDFVEGLRAQIIAGSRAPNSRVQLDELKKSFNLSLSPIREGLSHLVAEGFLVANGQRGYRVAPLCLEEFMDLQKIRIDLEIKALQESIRLGDEAWELSLMAAFKRLQNFESRRWASEEVGSWEERHHVFHETLISACHSPLLIRFCHILHQMSDRYRRVCLRNREPDHRVTQEHEQLYEAAYARNAERASEILRTHIERTGKNVLAVMQSQLDKEKTG